MCEWVWYAGWERLRHLALMRGSAASRRFARINIFMLAVVIGWLQATHVGWRTVTRTPTIEPAASIVPTGSGWLHIAGEPGPLSPRHAPEGSTDLWWNPAQAIMAGTSALIIGMLLVWVVLMLLRVGVNRVFKSAYRGEQRVSAALHYSTAWGFPAVFAGVIAGLRPVSDIGSIAQWPWSPPKRGFDVAAGVLAGFAFIMWWFWLVRLGNAAPIDTRGRVVTFFAIGVPLLVAGGTAGWLFGLEPLYDKLFRVMRLQF